MLSFSTTKAKELAILSHGSQKYGNHPYIRHLEDVALTALIGCEDPYLDKYFLMVVAYLHDIIEDTSVEYGDIAQSFGEEIAEAVWLVTDPPGHSRKVKKDKLYKRLSQLDESNFIHRAALIVKVIDRYCNMKFSIDTSNKRKFEMYKNEYKSFKKATYRQDLCSNFWKKMDKMLEKELNQPRTKAKRMNI